MGRKGVITTILVITLLMVHDLNICVGNVSNDAPPGDTMLCPESEGYQALTGGLCVKPFHTALTWSAANKECVDMGGRLPVVDTEEKSASLTYYLSAQFTPTDMIWIGLLSYSSHAESSHQFYQNWVWTDCRNQTYTNFAEGEPGGNVGKCAFIKMENNGKWHDHVCSETYKYICEKLETRPSQEIKEETDNVCPVSNDAPAEDTLCPESEGYQALTGGLCVKPFHTALTWSDAYKECVDIGGRLPVVDTEEKSASLTHYTSTQFSSTDGIWIGLLSYSSHAESSHQFYQNWVWTDCRNQTYTNFAEGEPGGNVGKCAFIKMENNGKWHDHVCSETYKYICEKLETRPSPEIKEETDNVCPVSAPTTPTTLNTITESIGSVPATESTLFLTSQTDMLTPSSGTSLSSSKVLLETHEEHTSSTSHGIQAVSVLTRNDQESIRTIMFTETMTIGSTGDSYMSSVVDSAYDILGSTMISDPDELTSDAGTITTATNGPVTLTSQDYTYATEVISSAGEVIPITISQPTQTYLQTYAPSVLTQDVTSLSLSFTTQMTTEYQATSPSNSTYSLLARIQCRCHCAQLERLNEEEKKMKIEKVLLLDTRNLTHTVMRYKSRPDNRQSSRNLGTLGIAVIVLPFVLFILADVSTLNSQK